MIEHPTVDSLLEQAKRLTGLSEFASESWREGAEILLRDHARSDMLNAAGRAWLNKIFVDSLVSRLRVDDYHRRHPELADTPVERPVFILGIPRSGTTMLSYLMDADPARRSLLKWEAYNVVPPAAPGATRSDPRCQAEREADEALLKANPALAARHFEAADGPTEDVHLMAQDFRSVMLDVTTNADVYRDWILFSDATPAVEHRKRVYQVLQSTNPGKWTLKMPSDGLFIRTLFKVFPDAKVIWTHRDPLTCVASVFSLRHLARTNFNRDPDLAYMRENYPRQLALNAMRPLEVSQERPADVFHSYYEDTVRDPIGQMRKIYQWLGDEFTPEADKGMRDWLAANPQGRFGGHSYSLEKWGLDRADLAHYFHDYLKAHPISEGRA